MARSGDFRKGHTLTIGENNGMWKGDDVGRAALHDWVKRRKSKPSLCEGCHKELQLDLANKSGNYLRDLSDWEWLCRSCHFKKDGMVKNFKNATPWSNKQRRVNGKCAGCPNPISVTKSMIKRGRGKFCSRDCSDKNRGKVEYAVTI